VIALQLFNATAPLADLKLRLSEIELMRDVMELLRTKEQELLKIKRQVEALRIAAPLLGSEEEEPSGPAAHLPYKGTGKQG
jgi:hypothetical protein